MMRKVFELGYIRCALCIPRNYYISGALTKHNRIIASLLNKVEFDGTYPHHRT